MLELAGKPEGPGIHRLYLHVTDSRTGLEDGGVPGRYVALFGAWFRREDADELADDLQRLKRRIFGPRYDDPVILRRADIRGRRGPFGTLRDAQQEVRFLADLSDAFRRARCTLVSVVMDVTGAGSVGAGAHGACMAAVLKRYAAWLGFRDATGDAMARSAGAREDRLLRGAYTDVYDRGTRHMTAGRFRSTLRSRHLKLRPSTANVAGLQLAGLLGPVVFRRRLVEHLRARDRHDELDARLKEIAEAKFNRKEATGQVSGYGTAWIRAGGVEAEEGTEPAVRSSTGR